MSGPKAGVWSDFSTGESGGDLVDLWRAVHNLSLIEAMDEIRLWLGVERPSFVTTQKEYQAPAKPAGLKKVTDSNEVLDYCAQRGLTEETLKAFKVAAEGSRILFPFLDPKGDAQMIKFRDTKDKKKQGPNIRRAEAMPFRLAGSESKCSRGVDY